MKNSVYAYAMCLAVLMISSCRNERRSEANNIDFKEYTMDSTYHLFDDATKPAIKIHLSMNYPVKYKNHSVLDSLQRLIIMDITQTPNRAMRNPEKAMLNLIEQQIKEYRLLEPDYEAALLMNDNEPLASFSYEYTGNESNVFDKDGIFCFSTNIYSFTGGAHGLGIVKYTCVDLSDGSVITEKDLFLDDYESILSPIILEKLAEIQNVKLPKDLENNGFFDISDIKPNNNFYLNEKGITYIYNPYEIAAYVVGISEVFIPYEDISFILAPQSPIKRFL